MDTSNINTYSHEAHSKALAWGWSAPPEAILYEAEQYSRSKGKSLYEICVMLGFMTEDEADSYRRDQPATVRDMEYITSINQRAQQNKQRLHAITDGLQYISDLDSEHIVPHPEMGTNKELSLACDQHACVIVMIQESVPVLVFSNWDAAYQSFNQLAGASSRANAINKKFPNAIKAISSADQVSSMVGKIRPVAGKGGTDAKDEELTIIYDHALRADPNLRKLATIHELALTKGSSDIHIDPDNEGRIKVTHRVWGGMEAMAETLTTEQYYYIRNYLLQKSGANIKYERIRDPKDGMYQYVGKDRSVYVRCSYIPLGAGGKSDPVSICLRLIPMERGTVSLVKKGVHKVTCAALRDALTPDAGMVLVVGPTGSGKSTTVSGAIGTHDEIHHDTKTRFSIEDPIERYLPGITQLQVPYHMRGKSEGFTKILRNLLRHDPNLIWVGEIRDADTAEISVQAAATGHLLISTLHADTAVDAVDRLANLIPPEKAALRKALIKNLSLVVAQRLIRRLCTKCAFAGKPSEGDVRYVDYLNKTKGLTLQIPDRVHFHNEKGCDSCRDGAVPGFTGIIPVNDVLVIDREAKSALMDIQGSKVYEILEGKLKLRMEDAILEAVRDGLTPLNSIQY